MSWSVAILAGGQARRLGGQDKRALLIDGVTILDRQLAALRPLTCDITLVGGGQAPEPALTAIADLLPGTGALGALYTALATATSRRVLVLACDLPFVTTPFLEYLLRVAPDAAAVVPESPAGAQPLCAVYQRDAASSLRATLDEGDLSVRNAVARLDPRRLSTGELRPFDPDGWLLWNVNTPGDHSRAVMHGSTGRHRTAAF